MDAFGLHIPDSSYTIHITHTEASPGGVLTLTWYTYMCLPFEIAIGGFSSETKEPKLHQLGVFWANYCKKHPIWSKLGAFLSKMVYWWVGNLAKNWYRDSQIFEVRQAKENHFQKVRVLGFVVVYHPCGLAFRKVLKFDVENWAVGPLNPP